MRLLAHTSLCVLLVAATAAADRLADPTGSNVEIAGVDFPAHRALLLRHEDVPEPPLADLFHEFVRADHRSGRFRRDGRLSPFS